MARTLGNNDKERLRRIKLVGNYVRATHDSTRATADYFTKNEFKISNYTVKVYLDKFQQLFPERGETVALSIAENSEDTIKDPKVKNRVAMAAILYGRGHTIQEVAKKLDVSYWVIYRDLHSRLPHLDIDVYDYIKERLELEPSTMAPEEKNEETVQRAK